MDDVYIGNQWVYLTLPPRYGQALAVDGGNTLYPVYRTIYGGNFLAPGNDTLDVFWSLHELQNLTYPLRHYDVIQ